MFTGILEVFGVIFILLIGMLISFGALHSIFTFYEMSSDIKELRKGKK